MSELPIMTIKDIEQLGPCYSPSRYLPADWQGTALDILAVEDAPANDRLWVVCHEGWIDDATLRLFAVWCARQALALVDDPDPRSVAAVNTAERFARGEATPTELASARASAWASAWDSAWASASARDSARDSAWAAVYYSANAYARASARAYASASARASAYASAYDSAWASARASAYASASARASARDEFYSQAVQHLTEMLTNG